VGKICETSGSGRAEGVTDDESGESTEEEDVIGAGSQGRGELEMERLDEVDVEAQEVDSRNIAKHTESGRSVIRGDLRVKRFSVTQED